MLSVLLGLLLPVLLAQTITTYVPQVISTCGTGGVCTAVPAVDTSDSWCQSGGATTTQGCLGGCLGPCAFFQWNANPSPFPFTAQWIVGTRLVATNAAPKFGNDTITGAQIAFSLLSTNSDKNGISVQSVTMVNPTTGRLVTTTTAEPIPTQQNFPISGNPAKAMCIPSVLPVNQQCTNAGYTWDGPGFSISTVNFTDPNFGIALQLSLINDLNNKPSVSLSNFRMLLFWQAGLGPTTGTSLPVNATGPGATTTAPGSNSTLGAIIGGTIAGVLVLTAGIIILIYFVRRKQLQKPNMRLENPIPYSAM